MLIGILQCGHFLDADRGGNADYDALFRRLLDGRSFRFRTWDVVDLDFPESVHDADGWLITGSKHGVYDDLPFIPLLEEFVREAFAAGVPLVGICFGHQLIAQAFGGKVVKFPAGWALGAHDYDWDGRRVCLNAWHQDQVVDLPDGARVIARSPFCENAAVLYGDRVLTVQAHPEFDSQEIGQLIDSRGKSLPPDRVAAAADRIEAELDSRLIAERIADFFQVAHG